MLALSASANDGVGGGNGKAKLGAGMPDPGRNAATAATGDGRRRAVPGGGQRVAQRHDDQPAHRCGVAEPHLGLRRVDVDVDVLRRPVDKQRDHRVAVAGEHILVGAADRPDQQLVAHRPPVDDEILVARRGAVEGRQPDQPGQAKAAPLGIDLDRILGEVAPQQRREPGAARDCRFDPPAAASRNSKRSSSPMTVNDTAG